MNNDVIVYPDLSQSQYNIVNALFDLCDNEKPIFTLEILAGIKNPAVIALPILTWIFQFL